MLSMQTFYNQIQSEKTPYLMALSRVFRVSRKALADLSVADEWTPW